MISAEEVDRIAKVFASHDFQVTVQRYITGDRPWIITVGEHNWQRHIVPVNTEATLNVLSHDQSNKFGFNIDVRDVVATLPLETLTEGGYAGLKLRIKPY